MTRTMTFDDDVLKALGKQESIELLHLMVLIRQFEQTAYLRYLQGEIPGTLHQCQGQEAVAVGVCSVLESTDWITSTHRPHGHALAKGMDPAAAMAEIYGRETGCLGGRGGSMHIADVEKGNLGANGIVGGGIPIAVGAALAAKRLGTKAVTVCFFGDGANNEGAFHEALNIASVWKLPVVFVCENNKYGMSTSTERSTAVKQIATRAIAYDMPGESVDGNDFSAVAQAVDHAVKRARDGDGPSLIENITYRWRGHSRSDRNRYRTKEEIAAWQEKDPIARMRVMLTEHGIVDANKIGTIENEVEQIIEAAITFAMESPDRVGKSGSLIPTHFLEVVVCGSQTPHDLGGP